MAAVTIDTLLSRWEERRSGGDVVTAEELCGEHPELLETLSAAIERRRAELALQEWNTSVAIGDRPARFAETVDWPGQGKSGDPLEGFAPPEGPGEIARLGPFGIVRLLGAGGMGAVFEAVEAPLGRRVALKVMAPRMAGVETARVRFLREARAAAALEDDHVVPIYRVGEDNGIPYLTMPLLHGQTLDARLKQGPRLSIAEVLRIGREIAEGLAVAHARGMVHRDVKPANIWLEEGHGRVKILDFGLARVTDEGAHLTQEGAVLGTPAYMSPEQASGSVEVGHLSDLFSLGSVLYRMATTRPPFTGSSEAELLLALVHEDPVRPRQRNPAVPEDLDALIMRLLAKDPGTRPASAAAVVEAIRALEQAAAPAVGEAAPALAIDVGEEAPEALVLRPPAPVASRGGRLWWIATAAVALLVGSLGMGLLLFPQLREAALREGTLVLEAPPAAEVAVAVELAGRKVGTLSYPDERVLHLRRGTYDLLLSDTSGALRLAASRVVVRPGERQLVRVLRTPPASALPPTPTPPASLARAFWPTPPPDDKRLPGFIPHPLPAPALGPWQIETRRPRGAVAALAWSPESHRLACATSEPLVRIYGPFRLDLVGLLTGPTAPVTAVAWSPSGESLAAGGGDGTVRTWHADGRPKLTLRGHSRGVTALAWSPDGTRLASSSKDLTARVWSGDGAPGPVLSGHAGGVNGVAWSPDGTRLVTAGDDATARIWQADGSPGPVLEGHAGPVLGAAWSPDGTRLATAGDDRTVRLWEASGSPGPVLAGHAAAVRCVAWSPDSASLASGSADHTVRLWSREGKQARSIELYEEVASVAWSPNGRQLAAGGVQGMVRRWEAQGTAGTTLEGAAHRVSLLAVSRDGNCMVLGYAAVARVRIWGVDPLFGPILKGHTAAIRAAAWSPDGARLATASSDQTVRLWASADGAPGPVLEGHTGPVHAVAWSVDGQRLATTGADQTVRLWSADGTPGPVLKGHAGPVHAVAWDLTGNRLASSGADGTVRFWAGDGTPGRIVRSFDSPALCVAWSPDGSRLVAGDRAGGVRLLAADGTPGPLLKGHSGPVNAVAWDPEGERLATAGDDTVRLWNAEGQPGPVLTVRENAEVIGLAWTADAQGLIAASDDGFVRYWEVPTLATRWIAFHPGPLGIARFANRGRNTLYGTAAMNALVYLVAQPDGSVRLMTNEAFRKSTGW